MQLYLLVSTLQSWDGAISKSLSIYLLCLWRGIWCSELKILPWPLKRKKLIIWLCWKTALWNQPGVFLAQKPFHVKNQAGIFGWVGFFPFCFVFNKSVRLQAKIKRWERANLFYLASQCLQAMPATIPFNTMLCPIVRNKKLKSLFGKIAETSRIKWMFLREKKNKKEKPWWNNLQLTPSALKEQGHWTP